VETSEVITALVIMSSGQLVVADQMDKVLTGLLVAHNLVTTLKVVTVLPEYLLMVAVVTQGKVLRM